MSKVADRSKSGIAKTSDGSAFIPASKRADGSTRREIRVRPGYTPPEDVETYKNRTAESWKNKADGGVPGAEVLGQTNESAEMKSKNAKRREAARKKAQDQTNGDVSLMLSMKGHSLSEEDKVKQDWNDPAKLATNKINREVEEAERQKKTRNQLKKLKAVRELKEKKVAGEKLSADQLIKIAKESELIRDLQKLKYDGPELGAELENGESG